MKPIKLLVVDDGKRARDELVAELKKHPDFEVAAVAASGPEALKLLEKGGIDAAFLDIEMPEMTGLELASILGTWASPPRVVFATAYHYYAVAAFEANAVDYILKPYRPDRIAKTLEKIRLSISKGSGGNERLQNLSESLFETGLVKKMAMRKKNSRDRIIVDPAEIDYFYAKLSDVFARVKGEDYVVRMPLNKLAESLAARDFAPCHRAYLVNLAKIEKIAPLFNSTFEISLKGGAKIPLTRKYASLIRRSMGDIVKSK